MAARSYIIASNSPTIGSNATTAHPVFFLRGSGFKTMPRGIGGEG